jgi:DMSO/TMAO reductase YedYZ molybdopterin-dependent catalytic subunit
MTGILRPSRRRFLTLGAAGLGALALPGCERIDRLSRAPTYRAILDSAEGLTQRVQRWLIDPQAMAREFSPADLSPDFRANGTVEPDTDDYAELAYAKFTSFRLIVRGRVERPTEFTLAELKSLPARTQITRHDCVEGWSSIGQWSGPQLSLILRRVGIKPDARYVVFHCADRLSTGFVASPYYESIDLIDALHPQTILATEMNGAPLPIAHGAPLRLRVERQLGYKMAKYVMQIEVTDTLADIGDGNGGFWEDQGYEWYAGI